ncbi:S-layer homology domain-containing protein [Paenibacillus sp. GXUN7292]|uniref:S-layer homology domain-containing protein n=1 Tax=Paenibacillus sp. GXUN7292 TaxID=3422499 RepID=UPI003D7E5E5A
MKWRLKYGVALAGMLLFANFNVPSVPAQAASNEVVFNFADLPETGKKIDNKFSDVNVWDYDPIWLSDAEGWPSDHFSTQYPFIKNVQLMSATGGNDRRDLFIDPDDLATMTDYKFDALIEAAGNIVDMGLKPFIKTGTVPQKYSAEPHQDATGLNERPPADYDQYYDYINAIADALVTEFGINEVKTWTWGVLTEYENGDWFKTSDGLPESAKIAYFKLYDYTVAALEDAIGAENLKVGAHSMTVLNGLWDEREFIDHVASGVNYKTGQIGTQIDYLSASFYDNVPGGYSSRTITQTINTLRDRAIANGLTDLEYGIDEGRILSGPDGKPLRSRTVAHSYQGSADAMLFKTMIDHDIDWMSSWTLDTNTYWGGVPVVSAHLANLAYRMAGDIYVKPAIVHDPADTSNEVDGIGGYNPDTNTAHVMLYNHNADLNAVTSETPTVTLHNLAPAAGNTVTVKQWIIDDEHANFWPTWNADITSRGLHPDSFDYYSKYSADIPYNLHPDDLDYWNSREAAYKTLAALTPVTTTATIVDNKLTFTPTLAHHSVVLYEITNVAAVDGANAVDPGTAATDLIDHMNNWLKVNSQSDWLRFDTTNAHLLEDASRVMRVNHIPLEEYGQWITYRYPDIAHFQVTSIFSTDVDPSFADLKFYTSADGLSWTEQTNWNYSDTVINSGSALRRVYEADAPIGVNYIKIEFPAQGTVFYSPQLSKVTISGVKPLKVNVAALAAGTAGTAYQAELTAGGGIGAYTWSLSSGVLPPGTLLDPATGIISGTPTAAGNYAFTAQVEDEAGRIASKEFTISIAAYSPPSEGSPGGTGENPNTKEAVDIRDTVSGVLISNKSLPVLLSTRDRKNMAQVLLPADVIAQAFEFVKKRIADRQIVAFEAAPTNREIPNTAIHKVGLPASALMAASKAAPQAILSIRAGNASYDLPVSLPVLAKQLQQLESDLENTNVFITFETITDAANRQFSENSHAAGNALLGDAYSFTLTVETKGGSGTGNRIFTLSDMGNTYVTRTVSIAGSAGSSAIDPSKAAGVRIDPLTGAISFVPSIISLTEDGAVVMKIMSTDNCMYGIIQNDSSFNDLNGHWSKAAVEQLASKLIIRGMTASEFAPEKTVTRAEFVAMITRALGIENNGVFVQQFNDVQEADWFAGAVQSAVQAGLITGFENGSFLPDERITREQMAVIAFRALSFAGKQGSVADLNGLAAAFNDNSAISPWAKPSVAQLVEAGVMTGLNAEQFSPKGLATRAQAAVIIKRLLQHAAFIN